MGFQCEKSKTTNKPPKDSRPYIKKVLHKLVLKFLHIVPRKKQVQSNSSKKFLWHSERSLLVRLESTFQNVLLIPFETKNTLFHFKLDIQMELLFSLKFLPQHFPKSFHSFLSPPNRERKILVILQPK